MEGSIVTLKIEAGYGFIRAGGRDVFFHCTDLADGLTFDATLQERPVRFNVLDTAKGPRAINVRPLD